MKKSIGFLALESYLFFTANICSLIIDDIYIINRASFMINIMFGVIFLYLLFNYEDIKRNVFGLLKFLVKEKIYAMFNNFVCIFYKKGRRKKIDKAIVSIEFILKDGENEKEKILQNN